MHRSGTTAACLRLAVALCLGPAMLAVAMDAVAMDTVTLRREGEQIEVTGRVTVTAQDGGLLLMGRDGVLWAIPPEQLVEHVHDETPFEPFSADEVSRRMLARLPEGFDVHATSHYLIFYDTSRAYAQWCGSLFERLYMAFTNYWRRKGFDLTEPEFPLAAVVFADREAYLKFSQPELGEAGSAIIGYFSLRTNRMTMYDLTGIEAFGGVRRRGTLSQINAILSQPAASQQVSTIVHEATHQIAFNCGLHTRYSDCPLWFSEGIAVFFETPDLRSATGWRGIGVVNRSRQMRFRGYLRNRPPDSLARLIRDDTRFRDPQQSLDAYGEAWSLTYFLIRFRAKQYVEYLKMLSEKKPLLQDSPEERLAQFREVFGDLDKLDAEFLRQMSRVR